MKNKLAFLITIMVLLLSTLSCEFDYNVALGHSINNRKYVAEKSYNTKTGETVTFTSSHVQFLIFSGDTLSIVKNDSIIEKLVNYDFPTWQDKKEGKVIYNGLSKQGSKSLLIEVVNIKNVTGTLILSPIMKSPYQKNLDTIKTYYKSL
jgi:hypothetical protein